MGLSISCPLEMWKCVGFRRKSFNHALYSCFEFSAADLEGGAYLIIIKNDLKKEL